MKTFTLPGTDIVVPNVVLGLMRIAEKSDDEIRTLVAAGRDAGITMIDHADIYGGAMHVCERRFAEAMRLTAADRAELVIQTKCGIVPPDGFDFSSEHIIESVDGSLAALGTDYLDILLLHRPDALVEPEEVARAFDELEAAGKVRAFGVSNQTPGQIELLKKHVRQPIVANQLQLSITHSSIIARGVAANMQAEDQSIDRDGGILDYCRLNDITIQAWSPFQAGFFTGVFLGSPDYPELNAVIDRLAGQYDVPPIAIATAWITRHPAQMQVVLGTTSPDRVTGAARGSDIPLTRPEWYELFRAAGYILP
ncbi:aldo/keto reductase [Cellulomonas sp. Root930]|nr:aldo/keto reductase [Cellulomonas sp. Root930]